MEKIIISSLFFLLPLFSLPYQNFYNFELGKEFLFLLLSFSGLAVWLIRSLAAGNISYRQYRFHPFLGAFLLWTALSLLFAPNPYFVFHGATVLLGAASVYWLLANRFTRIEDFYSLIFLVAVSAGIVSLLAILQSAGIFWETITDQYGEPMVTGTFDHANHAAQFLILTLPLTAGLLGSASAPRRGIAFFSFLLQFAFLILTRSRAAWVVVFLTLPPAFFLILRPFRRRHLFLLLALVLITLGLFLKIPETASQRTLFTHLKTLFSTQYSSNRIRLWVWQDTLKLIRSHPLRGVGPENFPVEFPRVQSDRLSRELAQIDQIVESPHNEYLRIPAESGLVGVTILFAALVLLLLPLIRALRSREIPEENSRLLFALLFALGALFLDAGVDHPLTKTAPLLLLALLAAGLARLSAEPERTRTIRVSSPFRGKSLILLVLLASGAVLFLLSGWIVSDYFRAGARKVARHSYTEAVVKIEKSLKINQTSYLSHFLHGNYLSSLGKAGRDPQLLAKSLPAYRQAVKLYPTFYPAFLNQGQVLLWLELPLESRKALEGALALQPYQPEANFLLSAILLGLGETGEARRRFQLALSFRPRLREEFRDDPKFKPLFSDPAVIESEKER
jgi:O-antigen ligase